MTNVTATHAESVSGSIEQFGYRQELKRSLSLFDLVVYGLIFIQPIATGGIFGLIYNASRGMAPLVYALGLVAMLFTALSYVTMSRAFPIAGSVYAYAGRGIAASVGFIAGWAMLLDYVLLPALVYVALAIATEAVLPGFPRAVSIILLIAFNTGINLLGIEATARISRWLLVLQLALLAVLLAMASVAIANGVAGAHLSSAPFFNPAEFNPNMIFSALSIAMVAFLGFDAVSTLAEEARAGAGAIGRATLWSLFVATVLFIVQNYFLFVLGQPSFLPGEATEMAAYTIAGLFGGLFVVTIISFVSGIPGALTAQVATARLLFSMARDGKLPRGLAHIHPERKVPDRAILLVAAVNLVVALLLANQLGLLVSLVNFGALLGFLLLHVSVIVHFVWRQKSTDWLRHLLVPLIGFVIIAYVLVNMALPAKIAGVAWLSVGLIALIGLKLGGKQATLPA